MACHHDLHLPSSSVPIAETCRTRSIWNSGRINLAREKISSSPSSTFGAVSPPTYLIDHPSVFALHQVAIGHEALASRCSVEAD